MLCDIDFGDFFICIYFIVFYVFYFFNIFINKREDFDLYLV